MSPILGSKGHNGIKYAGSDTVRIVNTIVREVLDKTFTKLTSHINSALWERHHIQFCGEQVKVTVK